MFEDIGQQKLWESIERISRGGRQMRNISFAPEMEGHCCFDALTSKNMRQRKKSMK